MRIGKGDRRWCRMLRYAAATWRFEEIDGVVWVASSMWGTGEGVSFWRSDSIECVSLRELSREDSMPSISMVLARERRHGCAGLDAILRPVAH